MYGGRNILCFPYSLDVKLLATASISATQKTVNCPAVVCRKDPPTIKSDYLRKKKAVRERECVSNGANCLPLTFIFLSYF